MSQFTYRNESFTCRHCGLAVQPSERTCRNHCPHCLYSVHLDVVPGDRSADCGGLMQPVRIEYHSKKGYQLVHRCTTCGHIGRNILLRDVRVQPDEEAAIYDIMQHPKEL